MLVIKGAIKSQLKYCFSCPQNVSNGIGEIEIAGESKKEKSIR